MTTRIPTLDPIPEVEALWDELMTAISGVLRSGSYIMGPQVKAFEAEAARYLGVKHAIGVNSGTDALVIGLKALGIGPGDEVITTPFTFFATAESISMVGATPVFVDILPDTLNLDPVQVERAITARTRAILPVHLFGHSADMEAIMALAEAYGLSVLEDVAQAFGGTWNGRKLGTIGHVGAYSFFPSKNLGAFGDGGLIATDDDAVAEAARMLLVHGAKKKYHNEIIGYNSRLDELQAAILRVKLPHLDANNAGRREAARRYRSLLADVGWVRTPVEQPGATHVYHQYTVRVEGDRDRLQQRLAEVGIDTMIYYPVCLHRLPVYADRMECFPLAEQAQDQVLSLPIWPSIGEDVQRRVVEAMLAAAPAAARKRA